MSSYVLNVLLLIKHASYKFLAYNIRSHSSQKSVIKYSETAFSIIYMCMCNSMAWYTNKLLEFLWTQTVLHSSRLNQYCYERDFMANLQKEIQTVWPHRQVQWYLSISGPYIHQWKPRICWTYISKDTSVEKSKYFGQRNIFLGFKYKSNIHNSVHDKRDDSRFPIINLPWLSGDVPRLPSYGIYISQLVPFARCCTSVFYFHSKNLQITSKLSTQGYRYHQLRKTFWKFFRSYFELLSKFDAISFQEYLSKGITHPSSTVILC